MSGRQSLKYLKFGYEENSKVILYDFLSEHGLTQKF